MRQFTWRCYLMERRQFEACDFRDATMDVLLVVMSWVLPLAYLALAIDYGATFILRSRIHNRNAYLIPTILLHAAYLVLWGVEFNRPPLATSSELLSVIAVASLIVYWAVEFVSRDRRAGVFVFLVIFLMQYTSSMFMIGAIADQAVIEPVSGGEWARLHSLPACLAYSALVFAAVYAMLYLAGRRNLKLHRFGLLFDRLPPLELLGKMSWYALLGGFALMTITMITGVIFARHVDNIGEMEFKLLAKTIIGSIAWLTCAIAIVGKYLGKWSSTTVSRVAVLGFMVIVALFVVSALLS